MNELRSRIILVIEDDDSIRETLRVAVEMAGYSVVTAEDGRAGLDQLRRIGRPSLILLDLMMPVMDGFEFDRALSDQPETDSIPVVVVTAFPEKAKSIVHAKGVLSKPIELEKLLNAIEQHCD